MAATGQLTSLDVKIRQQILPAGDASHGTPDPVLKRQLEIYDDVVRKKAAENPIFKEIVESQLAFAKRATQWEQDTVVNRRMAFEHYFGANAKKPI